MDMEEGLRQEELRRQKQAEIIANMPGPERARWLQSQPDGGSMWKGYLAKIADRKYRESRPKTIDELIKEVPYETRGNPDVKFAPAAQVERRKFPWREGEKAPERDWEAILDFQKFVGSKPGPYIEGKGRTINFDVDKALKNPGMVNESFAKNLTVTNLTPELRASLEAKGFKFKTWDEKLFPGMNKLGDGKLGIIEFGSAVDAVKSLAALKAAGADTNMEGLRGKGYRFYD
jgi:hypothetical protein